MFYNAAIMMENTSAFQCWQAQAAQGIRPGGAQEAQAVSRDQGTRCEASLVSSCFPFRFERKGTIPVSVQRDARIDARATRLVDRDDPQDQGNDSVKQGTSLFDVCSSGLADRFFYCLSASEAD